MRQVLFIAMHFPPYATGSGYLRTLKFCEYLPQFGWKPVVLTMTARTYGNPQPDRPFAPQYPIYRAAALDAARHLAIRGRYPGAIALPDRWASWTPHAIWLARKAIRTHRPDVIVSTYPVATAHLIGLAIHRLYGIPWVADFRDPMVDETYPSEKSTRMVRSWIERKTVERSSLCVFTSPGTCALYRARYPAKAQESMTVIYNGYDEKDFERRAPPEGDGRVDSVSPYRLVHSGVLYRDIRDPSAFFQALATLKNSNEVSAGKLQVILRSSGSIEHYGSELAKYCIEDMVKLEPALQYPDALEEMMRADGLLLFQGRAANRQIPTKLFEYFRSQKPILALVDEQGDTAKLIRSHNAGFLVQMEDPAAIASALRKLLSSPRNLPPASSAGTRQYSRKASAERLAGALNLLL